MKKLLSLLTTPVFASTTNNEKNSQNVSTNQLESSVDSLASSKD